VFISSKNRGKEPFPLFGEPSGAPGSLALAEIMIELVTIELERSPPLRAKGD